MKKICVVLFALAMVSISIAEDLKKISLDSEQLYFKGCRYVYRSDTGITPARFSKELLAIPPSDLNFNPLIATWNSGVQFFFATASKEIQIDLSLSDYKRNKIGICRVYRDEQFFKDIKLKSLTEISPARIQLESPDGKPHHYRLILPTTMAVRITGFSIEAGTTLEKVEFKQKPIYVALGDSITHGNVALDGASEQSYPFILANRMGHDLYNLGIGGGRVSPPIGEMLADWKQINLITLLIGYNDFSWAGVPVETYRSNYIKLLKAIRESHPDTPLYCITLTHTTNEKSSKTGLAPELYREAVQTLVETLQQEGDKNLYLLHGDTLTDASFLHDPAHLSAEGNQIFADHLYTAIFN